MLSGESPGGFNGQQSTIQPLLWEPTGEMFSDGAVAQLGERLICIQEVIGSIPFSSTNVL